MEPDNTGKEDRTKRPRAETSVGCWEDLLGRPAGKTCWGLVQQHVQLVTSFLVNVLKSENRDQSYTCRGEQCKCQGSSLGKNTCATCELDSAVLQSPKGISALPAPLSP
ncbi:unnamed protein product [Boreogadus saida]